MILHFNSVTLPHHPLPSCKFKRILDSSLFPPRAGASLSSLTGNPSLLFNEAYKFPLQGRVLATELRCNKRKLAFGFTLFGLGFSNLIRACSSMAWLSSGRTCADLVSQLKNYGIISHPRVANAMTEIDRGLFVSGHNAYIDTPQPIGYNATISAPHMHALCLELLEPYLQPGMKALDVGSGTGYLTACFAVMVGEQGRAVGVEHIPELVEKSIVDVKRSKAGHLLEKGSLSLHCADGREGWLSNAPYNAIHVGAAAPELPRKLIEQLKPGGRLVVPVGKFFQELRVIDKHLDGSISETVNTQVRYVPLTSKQGQLQGEF